MHTIQPHRRAACHRPAERLLPRRCAGDRRRRRDRPRRQRAGARLCARSAHAGLASSCAHLVCQRAPRRKAVSDHRRALRLANPLARPLRAEHARRGVPSRARYSPRRAGSAQRLPRQHRLLLGVSGERPLHAHRPGRLPARARPHAPLLCGLAYDFCVRFSAIDGTALDFECLVIEDATCPRQAPRQHRRHPPGPSQKRAFSASSRKRFSAVSNSPQSSEHGLLLTPVVPLWLSSGFHRESLAIPLDSGDTRCHSRCIANLRYRT